MLLDFLAAQARPQLTPTALESQCRAILRQHRNQGGMKMLMRPKRSHRAMSQPEVKTGGVIRPDPESPEQPRDPEDRPWHTKRELREKMLDKTLADSFPTSDPPSTIPDPEEDDSLAA